MTLPYVVPGTTVEVSGDENLADVQRLLTDLPTTTGKAAHEVVIDGGRVFLDGSHLGEVDPHHLTALALWAIDGLVRQSASHTVIHASCVASDGRGVVVAGSSGAGKSTLAAASVLAGWGYLGDEFACIDPQAGEVRGYPRPLDLDADSRRRLGIRGRGDLRPASSLHEGSAALSAAPTAVVFPARGSAADGLTEPVAVDPVAALMALVTHVTALDRDRFLMLAALARTRPSWVVPVDDPAAAPHTLRTLVDSVGELPALAPEVGRATAASPSTVTVWFDDVAVVFDERDHRVHLLNAAAAVVWGEAENAGAVPSVPPGQLLETRDQLVELGLLESRSPTGQ